MEAAWEGVLAEDTRAGYNLSKRTRHRPKRATDTSERGS